MKNILKILFLFGLISIMAYGCRKEKNKVISPQYNSNITLYDKPLDVIRANIMWKWKMQYEKGGIFNSVNNHFHDYIWEFTSDNEIIQTDNGTLFIDSDIHWSRVKYMDGATYIMSYSQGTAPINLIVKGIYNDTLVFSDYGTDDALSYYLTRLNQ